TILFFHGNGEMAVEYDSLAPLYRQVGVNLIVTDYRGYGASNGHPSFAALMSDAHKVLHAVRLGLAAGGYTGPLFTMGRSLGTHAAAEIAAHYPEHLAGMISESGASSVARLVAALTQLGEGAAAADLARRHEAKLRSIRIPVLLLHGADDELVPLETAQGFYETLETPDKQLVIIPKAGHNSILLVGMQQYFTALRQFVQAHS
ncbi:MAG: alpha/beta fold hydrolase, partial [Chloroflexi bacterium]|nr:alpha/beta fold hydrolase [Chloroflexota bacterium]